MSRRSPSNERYQKFTGPKGQTRKSAAAAKPSRREGSGAAEKAKAKSASKSSAAGKYYEPDTPEYKFWRRMWWVSLGVGLALVAVSFFVQYYLKAVGPLRVVGVVALGLAYAAIIAAFFIDWRKMRPMRLGTYVSKKALPSTKSPAETPDDIPSADDSSDSDL